ncbi:MAG TPA: large conductance mechanosensitive channel protein MscL, partial [Vicinamibacterales bacterium]
MWTEFREFIARGNVIDLAVGVVIGAAFGRIVTALVEGVIMPPFGLVLGRIDFSSLFYVLDASKGVPISLADAKTKGIPVIAYGQFVNEIIAFLIVAFAVFLLVKQVNRIKSA